MMQDKIFMSRALDLARRGRFTTHPNPNVGCVIVKDKKIVGEGFHYSSGKPHAEIFALHEAGRKAIGATAYITLEPCSHYGHTPPCCEAITAAGISRVVTAMQDPNPQVSGKGLHFLQKRGIDIKNNLMENEATQLNKGFIKRMRTGLPYVQLKLGISLDGKTAMAGGESKWITSSQSRQDTQYLRAQSHAILTSSSTVLIDNPKLTVRWNELSTDIQKIYPEKNIRQPLRIVIDSHNRVRPEHCVIKEPGDIYLARTKIDDKHWPLNTHQIQVPKVNGYLNLEALMTLLGKKKINSILVEAGETLSGALLQKGIVDELVIYMAPKLLGSEARGLCVLPGLKTLADAIKLNFNEIRPVGPDLCLHLTILKM